MTWRLETRSDDDGDGFLRWWQYAVHTDGRRIMLDLSDFDDGPLDEARFRKLEALGFPHRPAGQHAPLRKAQIDSMYAAAMAEKEAA